MSDIKIEQIEKDRRGFFKAFSDDLKAGLMVYSWIDDSTFVIEHTEVNADFSGKGIGKQLVLASVEFARNKGLKIVPQCPFARKMFDKTEAIRDVMF
ncbi:GNAT family N-acetyltransferase [Marinoscillum sp. MHG1-6]|uniref:GNAT family N-acetyltransferase n=1 Tax=Marinoscillum sp. MHG1-6 TaxID=2959627 RepID=UPI00215853B9|nr:GNAT family N-acetyltransferase [Marinoscillum sp. MHG1-6]